MIWDSRNRNKYVKYDLGPNKSERNGTWQRRRKATLVLYKGENRKRKKCNFKFPNPKCLSKTPTRRVEPQPSITFSVSSGS